ncbi:MAG: hypothetical protein GXC72_06055 [Chitinophagaceae bacterium]|nr:hypothetical protein [Chitinophagaceae bacterium]
MSFSRSLRLFRRFYSSFLLFAVLMDAVSMLILWRSGLSVLGTLFWFKIATMGISYYVVNSYKSHEYYYYQNLGYSKQLLWAVTLAVDFLLFLLLLILTHQLK